MAATLDAQKRPGRHSTPEQVFCNGLALLPKAGAPKSLRYYGILILFRTGKFWARVYDLEKPLNVVLASRLCNQKRGDRDIHKKKMIVSTKESHVSTSP